MKRIDAAKNLVIKELQKLYYSPRKAGRGAPLFRIIMMRFLRRDCSGV